MKKFVSSLAALLVILTLASCSVKYRHQVEAPGTQANYQYGLEGFMRYDGYKDVAGDMEIAVTEYTKKGSNVKVKLYGVIHIGDKSYYQKLQKQLDKEDLVLWEAVLRKGQKLDSKTLRAMRNKPGMYDAMSSLLGLSSQMREIDYDRKNFKHCDITLGGPGSGQNLNLKSIQQAMQAMKQISAMKKQVGAFMNVEKMEDYLKHNYATAMAKQGKADFKQMSRQIEPLLRLVRQYRQRMPNNQLLKNLEKQLEQMKKSFANMGKIIIDKRNAFVMTALNKEIQKAETGKKPFTIAIFYGAAHNPDFEKRLAKMGYQRSNIKWLKAWKINTK